MQFQEFQKRLLEEVRNQQGDGYRVDLKELIKNNGVRQMAICIRAEREEFAPTIHLEGFYREFCRGVSIRHLARQIWEQYEETRVSGQLPGGFFCSYEDVRGQIFCRLVNYEKNRDLLLHIPHENWQDLAVTYYYQVDPAILSDATILIRREHLKNWGIDEEVLRKDAWANSLAKRPLQFENLQQVLCEMEVYAEEDGGGAGETALSLLTNDRRCLGAVCICYPGVTEKIACVLEGDYYILPSSIHECLILPDDGSYEPGQLARMVREINRTQLAPQEVLSDHVYHYSFDNKALDML